MDTLSRNLASPLKRSLPPPGDSEPTAKRPRQTYHHHHSLKQKTSIPHESEPAFLDQQQYDQIFERALVQICQSVERDAGEDEEGPAGLISQSVLSTLREHTEEYLLNLCDLVKQSMLACRRTQPLPVDFEFALKFTSTRFDSLIPELKRLNEPHIPDLLPTPPPESANTTSQSFLGDEFDTTKRKYIPSTFPAFPSTHTFRQTSVYPEREKDPRRIRELAAEEGRLAEQALRKLAGAVRTEAKIDWENKGKAPDSGDGKARKEETMESMFEKTMQAVMRKESEDYQEPGKRELAPIVNCERKYWMPDSMLKLRKEADIVAEKAREKRREDMRAAKLVALNTEPVERPRSSATPRPRGSVAAPVQRKEPQRSASTMLKLKLKLKPMTDVATGGT